MANQSSGPLSKSSINGDGVSVAWMPASRSASDVVLASFVLNESPDSYNTLAKA
jgi:hypothetical protein